MLSDQAVALVTTAISLAIAFFALIVAWRTAVATTRQVEITEKTRKSSIRPHVVAYTRQYPHQDPVYLFIANVGFGAAKDVRARIVVGQDFNPMQGQPIRDWKVLREPVSILRVDERLWTILLLAPSTPVEVYKDKKIVIEIAYSDIEGTRFQPEQFKLDLFPNDGVLAGRTKRTRGKEVVEDRPLRPDDL